MLVCTFLARRPTTPDVPILRNSSRVNRLVERVQSCNDAWIDASQAPRIDFSDARTTVRTARSATFRYQPKYALQLVAHTLAAQISRVLLGSPRVYNDDRDRCCTSENLSEWLHLQDRHKNTGRCSWHLDSRAFVDPRMRYGGRSRPLKFAGYIYPCDANVIITTGSQSHDRSIEASSFWTGDLGMREIWSAVYDERSWPWPCGGRC